MAVLVALAAKSNLLPFLFHHKQQTIDADGEPQLHSDMSHDHSVRPPHLRHKIAVMPMVKRLWCYMVSVCLVFTVTIALYPGLTASFRSMNTDGRDELGTCYSQFQQVASTIVMFCSID